MDESVPLGANLTQLCTAFAYARAIFVTQYEIIAHRLSVKSFSLALVSFIFGHNLLSASSSLKIHYSLI